MVKEVRPMKKWSRVLQRLRQLTASLTPRELSTLDWDAHFPIPVDRKVRLELAGLLIDTFMKCVTRNSVDTEERAALVRPLWTKLDNFLSKLRRSPALCMWLWHVREKLCNDVRKLAGCMALDTPRLRFCIQFCTNSLGPMLGFDVLLNSPVYPQMLRRGFSLHRGNLSIEFHRTLWNRYGEITGLACPTCPHTETPPCICAFDAQIRYHFECMKWMKEQNGPHIL